MTEIYDTFIKDLFVMLLLVPKELGWQQTKAWTAATSEPQKQQQQLHLKLR